MLIKNEIVSWHSIDSRPEFDNECLLLKLVENKKIFFLPGAFINENFYAETPNGTKKVPNHILVAWANFPLCETEH
jgi:hypothetical protein